MSETSKIIENFSLEKFKKLVQLIISTRSETNSIVTNNKNGYFRSADQNGNLEVCRSLIGQSPERSFELETALFESCYDLSELKLKIFFKKRNLLKHELDKPESSVVVTAIRFKDRYLSCGGLQAHENIALIMLFICFATEDYYSPLRVDDKYLNEYANIYEELLVKSEERSAEGKYCQKAIELIEIILSQKRTVWPTKELFVKSN
jgi:hypothetical protein